MTEADLHLIHEVTTPQAFSALRERGLPVRRKDLTLGTMDHSTPTRTEQVFGGKPFTIESAATQVRALETGRTKWLILSGVCVGLGFEAKMARLSL